MGLSEEEFLWSCPSCHYETGALRTFRNFLKREHARRPLVKEEWDTLSHHMIESVIRRAQ